MSAIAHFLEEEGIATTLIALIRPHAAKAQPPRALWVPFQLGRPLGAPLDSAFQKRVLRHALGLLESTVGSPLLEDFASDEPHAANVANWCSPVKLDVDSIAAEIAILKPHYDRAGARSGRTTVGVSAMTIEDAAAYLLATDTAKPLPRPRPELSPVQCLRYAADDLKAFYLEALAEAGEPPSGWQMSHWFWTCTLAGQLIKALRENSLGHPDEQRRYAAWWLVPDGWSSREQVIKMRKVPVAP